MSEPKPEGRNVGLERLVGQNGYWCGTCEKPMRFNVPRLGPKGGFVHEHSGSFFCDGLEVKIHGTELLGVTQQSEEL